MRNLIILRGSPGAGKSTWIRNNNLQNYTLCADDIRMMFEAPIMQVDKLHKTISQANDNYVWALLFELLEKRMEKGELVLVDATHSRSSDFSKYKDLATKYRYRMYYVDFSDVPIEVCKERNNQREPYKIVPERVIDKIYARLRTQEKTSGFKEVDKDNFKDCFANKTFDFNKWDKVHIFGDIHGCFEPLKTYFVEQYNISKDKPNIDELFGTNKDGTANLNHIPKGFLNPNEFYVFIGDYIDRGIQNKEVLEFLISIKDEPNVLLLEGNHERWLWLYANDEIEKIKSKTFLNKTIPQIQGVNPSDLRQLYRKLAQMAYFTYNDKEYFVNHGGLPYMPEDLQYISTHQLIYGVGDYNIDIDEVFNKNEIQRQEKIKEKWLPIKGFEGYYEVSNYGRIRSLDRSILTKDGVRTNYKGRLLSQSIGTKGYPKVAITKDGKQKCVFIHRAAAEAFIENKDSLPEVNHIDENKLNNHISNLEWCSTKYNSNYGQRNKNMAEKHKKDVVIINNDNGVSWQFDSVEDASKWFSARLNVSEWCVYKNSSYKNYSIIKSKKEQKNVDIKIKPQTCFIDIPKVKPIFSVHGHRNTYKVSMNDYKHSINLQGFIEEGGHLRVLVLEKDKEHQYVEVKNNIFKEKEKPIPSIITDSDVDVVNVLRTNKNIRETVLDNNISSFNFTRDAFYNKRWDSITTTARGLFLDVENGDVIARGYNKFFNIKEVRKTELSHIRVKMEDHPAVCYKKYNGFLGLLSYTKGELFFATKSTNKGDFAKWFKEIFYSQYDEHQIEGIENYLIDTDTTMVFEVVDPVNDPHIIKCDKREVILLDVINNDISFNKLPYNELKELADNFKIKCKEIEREFETFREFSAWYLEKTHEDNMSDTDLEGVVIEIGDLMTKLKYNYYNFWKQMRGLKDRVRGRRKVQLGSLYNDLGNYFYKYLLSLPEEELNKDIVSLREDFERKGSESNG